HCRSFAGSIASPYEIVTGCIAAYARVIANAACCSMYATQYGLTLEVAGLTPYRPMLSGADSSCVDEMKMLLALSVAPDGRRCATSPRIACRYTLNAPSWSSTSSAMVRVPSAPQYGV